MRPGIHSGKGRVVPEEEAEFSGGGLNSCREKAKQQVIDLGQQEKDCSTPHVRVAQPV